MSFINAILSDRKGKIVLTKGQEEISVGNISIIEVRRYKCALVHTPFQDWEYKNGLFDADPGKYIIEYDTNRRNENQGTSL